MGHSVIERVAFVLRMIEDDARSPICRKFRIEGGVITSSREAIAITAKCNAETLEDMAKQQLDDVGVANLATALRWIASVAEEASLSDLEALAVIKRAARGQAEICEKAVRPRSILQRLWGGWG